MYKDKAKQKETTKERVRRYRALQKGVTEEGVTPQGVTPLLEDEFVPSLSVPSGKPRNLSVTQADIKSLPKETVEAIDKVCLYRASQGLFDDREERLERAARYRKVYPK